MSPVVMLSTDAHHGVAAVYVSHVKPIPLDNYQLISDNTSLYNIYIAYLLRAKVLKDIIQTNNLINNDKIQGNN